MNSVNITRKLFGAKSFGRGSFSRKPFGMSIDILVMALTAYIALSLGVMQIRASSSLVETTAVSLQKSLVS